MNKIILASILSIFLASCSTDSTFTQTDRETLAYIAIQYAAAKVEFKNKEQAYIVVNNLKTIIENGTFDKVLIDSAVNEYLINSALDKADQIAIKALINLAMSKITVNINIEPAEYTKELVVYLDALLEVLK